MEYHVIKLPKSQIEIGVAIPFQELEQHVKKAAVLISEEAEIEGFRKGKAPYEVIKQKVGEFAIYERAADLAVRKTYPEVMERLLVSGELSKERPPIGKPEITITKLSPANDLEYKVKLAILPEVKLPDYKAIAQRIQKEKHRVSVEEKEVEGTINWILESCSLLVTVDGPAQKGDRVEVDFEVRSGGVKIAQGESKSHPLILGQDKFLPGFEEEITGMKAGDTREFTLVAPDDWRDKSLAGKALDFKTTMKLVQERKVPELTDDFVKGLGNFSSAENFRTSVREGLTREKEEKETQRIKALIIEKIAEGSTIEVPDVLVEGELEKMMDELKMSVENMGMKWEDYLLHVKKNPEELRREWRDEAEKRVRIALVLREIAKLEKIEPMEEEVEARANEFLRQFRSAGEAEKAIDPVRSRTSEMSADAQAHRTSNGIDPAELREYTRGILRNQKVFEFLETI